MDEIPKIVSSDDHVVEPPHVWQEWLPTKFRERGPRVEQRRFSSITLQGSSGYALEEADDGLPADCWIYENRLIYVHKRHVAIPLDATPGAGGAGGAANGGVGTFDRSKMTLQPMTYAEMRPGCYDRKARLADMDLNWVEASLCFPTFPRFCGQTFYEGADKDLGLACVQAYNDWTIDEWCGDSGGRLVPLCLIPLWDVELAAAEVRRNAARGARAVCFSEIPPHLGLPSVHSGHWDPFFEACAETGTVVAMHIGSSSKMPVTSEDAPAAVAATLSFNNSFASLTDFLFSGVLVRFPELKLAYSEGQIGWIPYLLERADEVWENHNNWTQAKDLVPEPPSTYYYDHVFGCFTADLHGVRSIDEVGVDNITFETDYPHTDTSWPHSKDYVARCTAGLDQDVAHKVIRGNAIRMLRLEIT